ncbi:carboxylesterase/lipase family protein [Rhodotorula paludigena]|uniref:carboxylesterase/lipase family protein n=1 Tax=Rhodotorula paludigena TaxID=86838 RepID=UPI003181CC59
MRSSSSSGSALVALAALLAAAFFPAVLASPVSLLARSTNSTASPVAHVRNGTLHGLSLASFSQEAFLGIPYAQPPVGELRLRRPRALESGFDGGQLDAKAYSPICPGIGSDNWGYEQSEDCLTINVLRPAGTTAEDRLPVAFWIYGGGFSQGGSADRRYNASWVVHRSIEMGKPIMFVSINYRVSALGFLHANELRAEGNLNLGLYDQRLALHWVQENIAAFGGDPRRVTLWGESAGGVSIAHHLLAYGLTSTPLFHGAIIESAHAGTVAFPSPETDQPRFEVFANATGCAGSDGGVLECVRGLDLDVLNQTATAEGRWVPVVDGDLIASYPSDALNARKFVPVPLLIGANTDEGSAFGSKGLNSTSDFAAAIAARWPQMQNSTIERLLELYPNDPSVGCPYGTGDGVLPSGTHDKRSNSLWGDVMYHFGRRWMAQLFAEADQPVFSYRYNQPAENATVLLGTAHFAEVASVFSNPLPTQNPLGSRPGDAELARLMTSQWISFIHDGTPNNHGVDGAPTWPDYRDEPSNYLYSRKEWEVERDDYRQEQLAFLRTLGWELQQ